MEKVRWKMRSNNANITLEIPKKGNYGLTLIDLLGHSWPLETAQTGSSELTADLSQFKQGIYFLKVIENGRIIGTQKIIKQ